MEDCSLEGRELSIDASKSTQMMVKPGACGFTCRILVEKQGSYKACVHLESECKNIGKLAEELASVDFMQIVRGTFSENPVVQAAGRCKVHQSCVIPCAITKAVEAELKLAVKKDVALTYEHRPPESPACPICRGATRALES